MPHPNNYKNLTSAEFIKIIQGENDYFNKPQRSGPQNTEKMSNQALTASGKDPKCYIHLPTSDERIQGWREQFIFSPQYTKENRPDPKEPFVYRLLDPVHWDRGLNESTGEGTKSELTCDINLLGCEFNSYFSIFRVNSKAPIYLISCTFTKGKESKLIITKSKFASVHLLDYREHNSADKNSLQKVDINDLNTEELIISDMLIEDLSIAGKEGLIKKLTITNCIISNLSLRDTEIENVSISNTTVFNEFILNANLKKFSLLGKKTLNEKVHRIGKLILCPNEKASKSEYLIRESAINQLDISGTLDGKLLLAENEINDLSFNNLYNAGELRLINVNNVNRFSIDRSSMGKAEFLNIDLSNSSFVHIINSNLLDTVLINSIFPKHLKGDSERDYKGVRDAFRQLKFVSGKQGNRIQELSYEAFEMRAYHEDKTEKKTLDDKFILWLNWITNSNGQSWLKAGKLLLIITIPLFTLLKFILGYRSFCLQCISSNISQYLEFAFNPLHDFSKLFSDDLKAREEILGWAKMIDFLSKLLGSLILFQLVRAFRKYVK